MTQASGSAPPRDQTPKLSGAEGSIRVTPPPHFEHLPEGFMEAPSAVRLERDHKCSSGVPPWPTLPPAQLYLRDDTSPARGAQKGREYPAGGIDPWNLIGVMRA